LQFLEAKGLTPPEIDLALKQASAGAPPPPQYVTGPYGANPYALGAQHTRWDWRDYFVSTNRSVTGTFTC